MATKRKFWNVFDGMEGDKVVWIIVILLMLISVLCMFSSTSRLLEGDQSRLNMVVDQIVLVGMGLAVIIILYNIRSMKFLRACSKWGFLLSLALLLVLISGIKTPLVSSIELNGARRIIRVAGFQVHVFEVVKVAMVMYLAWAIDAFKKKELKGPRKPIWQKVLYIYVPFLITFLLIIPGSNSSALFIGGIMFITILIGGGSFKDLAILLLAGTLALGSCVAIYKLSDGKYMERIGTGLSRIFSDEDYESKVLASPAGSRDYYESLDKIRQPYSAKIAVHEGGLIGKGPGSSTQRYVVPDISEDYMYSFIIEEYGLLGGLVMIILYISLMARGSRIVRNCGNDLYAKLTVGGLSLLITLQAFLHMFVNTDIGPMTGQTLPLVSHGSSAFLCFSFAFGIILSISRIAKKKMDREQKAAEPLVETHYVQEGLGDLEDFENGRNMDELMEEDYDIQ